MVGQSARKIHAITVVLSLLPLLLLLAVACGTAAPAVPDAKPAAPAPVAGVPGTPTAVPAQAVVPKAPVVNPGKVTWMIGNFDNERFDQAFAARGDDYARHIHAFLISSDVKDGRRVIIPGIANKWEVSGDGLTWTFTIRKGVKFHDGTEVTAGDVLWTFQHMWGPQVADYATSSPSLNISAYVDKIEQTGPDRVSVTTKTPYAGFPTDTSEATGHWAGAILPKRATMHNVEEEAAYDRNPIGAGSMKLVKHVAASEMTLERFADYYHQPKNGFSTDKRVNFATLSLLLVPEEATRVAALRGGDADIAPVSLATRNQVEAGGGRLVFGQEGTYFSIRQKGCWKEQFPCHDKRVRQALNYAFDKDLMRDKLYGGPQVMQAKGWTFVSPSTIGYSPDLAPYPFDPNKARQLLAEAGYPGGRGFGKLVINTWVSPTMPLVPESAQLAADFWRRELGLDVEVKVGDPAALKKFDVLTEDLYGQILWRDNEARLDVAGVMRSGYATPSVKGRAHNDPELFALVNKTIAVFDPAESQKVLNETFLRLRDEAYDISVGYINLPWGVGPRIQTWEPYPLASNPSALHTIVLK